MTRLIAAALLATGAVVSAGQLPDPVIAEVAGTRITLSEFRQWLDASRAQGTYMHGVATLTPEGQERILRTLADQRLFAAAAREEGFDRETATQFLVEQRIAELLADRYRERVIGRPSEPELRAYYAANADVFRTGARVKARHILARTREDAQAALSEVRAGADFAEVARRRSADPASGKNGGDLGWVFRGLMVQAFDAALFSLTDGQVSDVVQTGVGFHVIKADEVNLGALSPFEAIRDDVAERVAAERLAAERTRLSARYGLTIHRELLQRGVK